jgi:hypothetical protein
LPNPVVTLSSATGALPDAPPAVGPSPRSASLLARLDAGADQNLQRLRLLQRIDRVVATHHRPRPVAALLAVDKTAASDLHHRAGQIINNDRQICRRINIRVAGPSVALLIASILQPLFTVPKVRRHL